ncbi:bacteriohemerythrin [Pseudomonas matsuisoli]|uniref:Bacteriohemerythrin n=1 Tax=Pseudomonas matsuisoli TaxID=1515666 RepID=A0A917UXE1_9PSED|nr:bacteriohemerythrin [Pseudomonas matsuisoli]GGJ92761.1 bacteriohemerythrin [Pseudomonas matsuisoli]
MAHFVWSSDLDTGIDVIDDQHRQIIAMINGLEDARRGVSSTTVADIIEQLVDYTISHFAFEESLMEEAGYVFCRAHKRVHEVFIKRVESLRTRFREGENVTDELGQTLGRWLVSHIRSDDRNYVEVVNRNLKKITSDHSHEGWLARAKRTFFGRRG